MVKPGNVLRFSPGSSVSAPALAVNNGESGEEVASAESEFQNPEPEISPDRPSKSDPTPVPPSFPDWNTKQGNYDKNGFSINVVKRKISANGLSWVPSIISDYPWQSAGKIIETEGGTLSASSFQRVIVELDTDSQNGDLFTIYTNSVAIEDPITGREIGTEVVTRAKLQIIEPVEGAPRVYRGLILDSVNPVRVGDFVRSGNHFSRAEFTVTGIPSPIAARIVNGEYPKRQLFGLHSVVYLDKGDSEGISNGTLLNVLRNVKNQNPESIIRFDPRPTGVLKVVNVGRHVSTAVVVAQRDAIYPGDETALEGPNLKRSEP